MGKNHRDNTAARKKRGQVAFDKRAKRRAVGKKGKCNICGTWTRWSKLEGGICVKCLSKQLPLSTTLSCETQSR